MATGTGLGATCVFGTQGGSYLIRSINGHKETRPKVDDSHLGTTGEATSIPGDLAELEEFDIEILFEGEEGLPTFAAAETITVTHPTATGESTPANVAGTGFVTGRKFPDMQINTLKIGIITATFDGKTGPTLTAAT